MLNALRCSENTGNVDMFRIALGEESLHTHLHADTCGKHLSLIHISSTLLFDLKMTHGPVSARVNNKVEGMHYRVYNSKAVSYTHLLYVPKGSKDAYCRSPWGRFTYIVEFEK